MAQYKEIIRIGTQAPTLSLVLFPLLHCISLNIVICLPYRIAVRSSLV